MRRHCIPVLAVLLLLLAVPALLAGTVALAPADLLAVLRGDADALTQTLLLELRLPRLLAAVAAGALLAVAGCALQALVRNPLADPALTGVASGAALGAALALLFLPPALAAGAAALAWTTPAAFAGAVAAGALVLLVARVEGGLSVAALLLAGIAVNTLVAALLGLLVQLGDDQALRAVSSLQLGSFAAVGPLAALLLVAVALLATFLLWRRAPLLDALLLGERAALQSGVDVARLKWLLVLLVCAAVGVQVALVGVLAFAGLVAPHIARLLAGPAHARLLPVAALVGAVAVLLADLVARLAAAPAELAAGLVLSLVGAPLFIALLWRERDRLGSWS